MNKRTANVAFELACVRTATTDRAITARIAPRLPLRTTGGAGHLPTPIERFSFSFHPGVCNAPQLLPLVLLPPNSNWHRARCVTSHTRTSFLRCFACAWCQRSCLAVDLLSCAILALASSQFDTMTLCHPARKYGPLSLTTYRLIDDQAMISDPRYVSREREPVELH
jgi:hypothetical protein